MGEIRIFRNDIFNKMFNVLTSCQHVRLFYGCLKIEWTSVTKKNN